MGKINVYDKSMIDNQKKRMWKSKKFSYMNLHLKDCFRNGIHSLLRRADLLCWCQRERERESWHHLRYIAHIAIL